MRLDKFLKVSRLIKRRTVANEACDAGRVTVNGRPAKASVNVKVGDIIDIGIALHRGQMTGLAAEGLTISRTSSLSEEVFRVVGQIFADDGSGQLRIIQLAQCLHVHLRKTFRDEQYYP